MARIYISSTFSDLQEYREEVYRALRKLEHDVVAMEDYVASDQRPLDKCLDDVACCDLYIGIFAWRYGYVPPDKDKSITELEFRTAADKQKKCLIFLLDDKAPWSRMHMDKDSANIEALRDELKRDFLVEFFSNKDELASDIAIAVSRALDADEEEPVRNFAAAGARHDKNDMEGVLKLLKPIIIVFLSILALTVVTMILCITTSIGNNIDLKLALFGLGGISTFLIGCLMFIFNKFVQLSRKN